jgi:hypothetical protein
MTKLEELMALADDYAFLNRTPAEYKDQIRPADKARAALESALREALDWGEPVAMGDRGVLNWVDGQLTRGEVWLYAKKEQP